MNSIWVEKAKLPEFPALDKDLSTEVLIVGGGLCGLCTAFMLKRHGIDCVVIEQDRICGKTSKNTTAKVTAQHGLIYKRLIKEFGENTARLYYKANAEALKEIKELCQARDCDFEEVSAFIYSTWENKEIKEEYDALLKLGIDAAYHKSSELPFEIFDMVEMPRQGQFNVLKFAGEIISGLRIYEHSPVTRICNGYAVANGRKIHYERVVIATHFPILNRVGLYFMKMHQNRSYALALSGAKLPNGVFLDFEEGGISLRSYEDYLIIGGGSHRTGKCVGGFDKLEKFAKRYFPNAKIERRWAAEDCMTLDGVPYVGRYSAFTPNIFVATGFNKWGMSSSMVAARINTELITRGESEYERIFSPFGRIMRRSCL